MGGNEMASVAIVMPPALNNHQRRDLLRIAECCDTGAAQGRSPFRFVTTRARFLGARKLLFLLGKGKQIPRFARDDNS